MDVLDDLHAALDGRYEIERELGRGGMAVVYLARDVKHDRQVAIKVLPPEMATSVGAERFLREIRTAARLSHPNILPLHDSIAVDQVRCYVMPYVQGESLRQRIDRERQLGIEQAVDITRQVAAGLDYAHAHGIVHRDIKPENILLVGDQAMIADFGLALAVYTASSTPFTATGMAVGTPAYMSPEQAAADHAIDGRTDVYSLGCVFFEMVAGMPPFRGATAGALLAAHATRTPPSLVAERSSCPPAMDAAVQKALAKVPADRFHTAGEFAHALDGARPTPLSSIAVAPRRPWMRWLPAAAAVGVLTLLALVVPSVSDRIALARVPLDSARVLVLPVDGTGGQRVTAAVAQQRLTSALMEWRDLRVIVSPEGSAEAPDASRGARAARRASASRFLAATVEGIGDSVELRATLYDSRGEPVRQQTLRVADDLRNGAAPYRALVANVLRTSDGEDDADDANPGTKRVAAWRAFTRGDSLRRAWSLPAAEAEFRRAVAADPSFGRAHLWLAQVALWRRPPNRMEWGEVATRALTLKAGMSPRDTLAAAAAAALADQRYPDACHAYRALHELVPQSDLPWYGIAYCDAMDPIVLRDARSPSGWRFRANLSEAVAALDSGLARTSGAPPFALQLLGGLLITEPSRTRSGWSLGSPRLVFHARPSLSGDSVVYIPYPASDFGSGGEFANRRTLSEALRRNIARLDAEYREWVRRAPASADAREALALTQELMGENSPVEGGTPRAFGTLAEARRLSTDARQQLRLATGQVRLLLKYGRFADARRVADSLLAAIPRADADQAQSLAGIAALVGNIERTTALLLTAVRGEPGWVFDAQIAPPTPVADAAVSFLASASLGRCDDAMRAYGGTLERLIEQYVPSGARATVFEALAVRPITLAVPCLGPATVRGLHGRDHLLHMQQSLAAGNVPLLRRQLDSLRTSRLGDRPGDVALDQTFQEAWLLVASGHGPDAGRHLDLPLTALATLSPRLFNEVPAAAALGRAMALGADLAQARGDSALAACYAGNVTTLWEGGSPELRPVVERMKVIAATSRRRAGGDCGKVDGQQH
jgi:tetratricopeptide (TPR) repeat protein